MSNPTIDRVISRVVPDSIISLVHAICAELDTLRNTSSATADMCDMLRANAQKLADAVNPPEPVKADEPAITEHIERVIKTRKRKA